ncbi:MULTISPECIES: superoxide dismutase [unclassified Pseudomonas]|uniref:superoxide dismutase n=1 Tax=unclassified Pseudomonas TaxID=196821 RepID=UPI00096B932F|nr:MULTISPECIES: superoxide dismutase [unclassified Pseudomonas]OLY76858.1 superoxide dismutase [Pseudomonas sp. ATCC PTA-122608]OWP69758.1 superoxide dismutase [Pseudomonas sp. K2I15]
MKLLCLDIPQPGATFAQYEPHMKDEVRHSWELYKEGAIRDIYFRQDRPGVAIIAEFESVEAARKSLAEFPLTLAGLIGWEVIPLGPFTNWESLFSSEND